MDLRFRAVAVWAGAGWLAAACSCGPAKGNDAGTALDAGSPASDAGATDAGSNLDRFCAGVAKAQCDWLVACGLFDPAEEGLCESVTLAAQCGSFAADVQAGYRNFNEAAAIQCLADTQAALSGGCFPFGSALFPALPSCSGLSSAASPTGGGCYSGADCASAGDSCLGTGCGLTCQAGAALGQPCNPGLPCSSGTCDAGTCWSFAYSGGPCTMDLQCAPQSYCGPAGRCAPLPTSGQACVTAFQECAPFAFCDDGGTCISQPSTGQPCSPRFPFCAYGDFCNQSGLCEGQHIRGQTCAADRDCQPGLSCDRVLEQCLPPVVAGANAECTGSTRKCGFGLACVGALVSDAGAGTTGTCRPLALGGPCATSLDCPFQATCALDGGAGSCIAGADGGGCGENKDCPAGEYCQAASGTCQPPATSGELCSGEFGSCAPPALCRPPLDGGAFRCLALPGLGQACNGNACLPPYACVAGTCVATGSQGEPCCCGALQASYCADGACTSGDAGDVCTPYGASCANPSDCASGLCLANQCCP